MLELKVHWRWVHDAAYQGPLVGTKPCPYDNCPHKFSAVVTGLDDMRAAVQCMLPVVLIRVGHIPPCHNRCLGHGNACMLLLPLMMATINDAIDNLIGNYNIYEVSTRVIQSLIKLNAVMSRIYENSKQIKIYINIQK